MFGIRYCLFSDMVSEENQVTKISNDTTKPDPYHHSCLSKILELLMIWENLKNTHKFVLKFTCLIHIIMTTQY